MDAPRPEAAHEPIILDGSNVAMHPAGGFHHLLGLEERFVEAGWEVVVIVDASLRHRLQDADRELLEARLEEGWIQVPKGTDADVLILEEADRLGAWVVSADAFSDHQVPPQRRIDPAVLMPQ